jgi:transcriptional regulator with XRE-family HTH domain
MAEQVRFWLAQQGLTTTQAAARAGISRTTFWRIRKKRHATPEWYAVMSRAFGLTPEAIAQAIGAR